MYTLLFIFSFALGTIIGSFLNVVAFRYGTKKDLGGRSSCMVCTQQLKWYELIPIVSFRENVELAGLKFLHNIHM